MDVISILPILSSLRIATSTVEVHTNPVLYCGQVTRANQVYYENCAPKVTCDPNALYRTYNGACNNLENPLWGSSLTPYLRLAEGVYADGDYEIRLQTDGTKLPGPRMLQVALFLEKSRDFPYTTNMHLNQMLQMITHDSTLLPPDFSIGPPNCCDVYPYDDGTPDVCKAIIEVPEDDPVYSEIGKTCMHFKRAMTSTRNFNCTVTPQIAMNQATAFIDSSQLYGHTKPVAESLRTFKDGKLLMSTIEGQEFCRLRKRNGSSICDGRDNVKICFDSGDPRVNQHIGISLYHTMFSRFHNVLVDLFKQLNPEWLDEDLYQQARRYVIATNQIIIYRDLLHQLLGKDFTEQVGLALHEQKRTMYDPLLIPQLTIEFSASAYRVPHNILPSLYNFIDENYEQVDSLKLNEWMNTGDPLTNEKCNFDEILRGMTQTFGRAPRPSYNFLISNFMHKFVDSGYQDLLSVDIQRGRDCGVPTYNTIREICGFSKAIKFDDFSDNLLISDIRKLEKLYATVDDVDLLVGALLEPACPDAIVGPTARCILADVFYRVRYGDRFFFDVEGHPGCFTPEQLDELRKIHLGYVFCAGSGLKEIPNDIFEVLPPGSSTTRNCEELLMGLDVSAWKCNPYQ